MSVSFSEDLVLLKEDRAKKLEKLNSQLKGTPKDAKKNKRLLLGSENYDPNSSNASLKSKPTLKSRTEEKGSKSSEKKDSGSKNKVGTLTHSNKTWTNLTSGVLALSLPKQEKERQESIFELILSETKFNEMLIEFQDAYVMSLSHLLSPTESQTIFSTFNEIIAFHNEFTKELKSTQNENLIVDSIGSVLKKFMNEESKINAYVEFFSNCQRSEVEIQKLSKSNSKFKKILSEVSTSNLYNYLQLNLKDDILKIASRLMGYSTILKVIAECTPNSHSDSTDLKQSIDFLSTLIQNATQEKKKKENIDRIIFLQNSIDFTFNPNLKEPINLLSSPDVQIIKEGLVHLIHVTDGLKLKKKKELSLIVIGDLVLLLLKHDEPTKSGKHYQTFVVPTNLENIITVDIENSMEDQVLFENMFELRISEPERLLFVLQAPTPQEKYSWLNILKFQETYKIGLQKKASLREVQAIRRRTSQRIGELMSNFQKASNSDVLQWPLTDVQMGLSEEDEKNSGRFYCLVKTLKNGDWLVIGPGDVLLATNINDNKSRLIFFHKEDLLKSRINCWITPQTAANKHQTSLKTIILSVFVTNDQVATYSLQFKTPQEASSFADLINQLKANNSDDEQIKDNVLSIIKKELENEDDTGKPPLSRKNSQTNIREYRESMILEAVTNIVPKTEEKEETQQEEVIVETEEKEEKQEKEKEKEREKSKEKERGKEKSSSKRKEGKEKDKTKTKEKKSKRISKKAALSETGLALKSYNISDETLKELIEKLIQENLVLQTEVIDLKNKKVPNQV